MQRAKARVDKHGRIVIPAEFRRALSIKEGDSLTVELNDGELRLLTFKAAVRRSQALVAKYFSPDRSLVDELIAERIAEAEAEDRGE
jgi:AbrB family looped-hinge helix DNA binding protein